MIFLQMYKIQWLVGCITIYKYGKYRHNFEWPFFRGCKKEAATPLDSLVGPPKNTSSFGKGDTFAIIVGITWMLYAFRQ